MVYDISPIGLTSLNPDEEGEDGTLLIEPKLTFELQNNAYDVILDVNLNNEDIEESWLVLSSKMFNTVHIVKLRDAQKKYDLMIDR